MEKDCLNCFNLIKLRDKVKCKNPKGKMKVALPATSLPKTFKTFASQCKEFDGEDEA